ncbi:hypothetical protein [Saccharospirillum salsuginis]|uniref:Uncharacterized protein n=1 Tax=Saccharospirillum salsuginis TaxID=418750 RepID=A0A918NB62_9GAMM|nr:hypothetical protein [Saccharospirillum salsuginis]GGX55497.1 hypothetical protein GCM10007392_23980 [Saccharospirillum salsuginis]
MDQSTKSEALSVAETTFLTLSQIEEVDPESRPMEVLRALIDMTREHAEQGVPEDKISFTTTDIVSRIKRTNDSEEARRFLNRHLKKLENHLEVYRPHLDSTLNKSEKRQRLRIKSETQGKRKFLCLDTEPLTPENGPVSAPVSNLHADSPLTIQYELFSAPKLRGLSKHLSEFAMTGRFTWSMALAPVIILISFIAMFLAAVTLGYPKQATWTIIIGISVLLLTIKLIWPFLQASDIGIHESPLWLSPQLTNQSYLVIEPYSPDQGSKKANRAIRVKSYTGTCPICGGKIYVEPGRRSQGMKGRIVGKCRYSPEHVFTFDHMTLSGRYALS